jgi:hypothetical protein
MRLCLSSEVLYLCQQHTRLAVGIDHTVEELEAKEVAAPHHAPAEEEGNGAGCDLGAGWAVVSEWRASEFFY